LISYTERSREKKMLISTQKITKKKHEFLISFQFDCRYYSTDNKYKYENYHQQKKIYILYIRILFE